MSSYNDNKPFKTFKPIKIGLGEKIVGSVKDFFKSRGRKVSPDIKSITPGKKFNKGGRVGLKRGTGLMKKKSNIQKIKEAFAPKNKSTKFGMLSVKAGIDKNPNPTQADRIAGAKLKNKKKVV
mgnify:FL=1